jgi:hypothetical protein
MDAVPSRHSRSQKGHHVIECCFASGIGTLGQMCSMFSYSVNFFFRVSLAPLNHLLRVNSFAAGIRSRLRRESDELQFGGFNPHDQFARPRITPALVPSRLICRVV